MKLRIQNARDNSLVWEREAGKLNCLCPQRHMLVFVEVSLECFRSIQRVVLQGEGCMTCRLRVERRVGFLLACEGHGGRLPQEPPGTMAMVIWEWRAVSGVWFPG